MSSSGGAGPRIPMIAGRELAPGELLPAERKLAEELNISRTPLRHALQELERQRVIRRKAPRGYIVAASSAGLSVMSKTIVLVKGVALCGSRDCQPGAISPRLAASRAGRGPNRTMRGST